MNWNWWNRITALENRITELTKDVERAWALHTEEESKNCRLHTDKLALQTEIKRLRAILKECSDPIYHGPDCEDDGGEDGWYCECNVQIADSALESGTEHVDE